MEMQWWHTNDIAHPPTWQRMQIYPNPMLGSEKSARMVNSAGEEFFNQQQDDPLAFGPYTVQLKALARQVRAGKARYDGGYYAGFDNCDRGRGGDLHDLRKDVPSAWPATFPSNWSKQPSPSHYRQGGIDVDTATMRSSVPGLYVAGGVGGHSNGLIALATYDGKVVADGVAGDLPDLGDGAPGRAGHCARVRAGSTRCAIHRATGLAPVQVKERASRADVGQGRGRKDDAGHERRRSTTSRQFVATAARHADIAIARRSANYEWLDAIDVVNMIDACELIIHSSLERKESRGPFFRRIFR